MIDLVLAFLYQHEGHLGAMACYGAIAVVHFFIFLGHSSHDPPAKSGSEA